jgi:glycosyltransferase involved in cell wall biosynthesis
MDLKGTVGIITKPLGSAGIVPVSNLVDILTTISDSVYIITANEGANLNNHKRNDKLSIKLFQYKYGTNIIEKMVNNILLQFKITLCIFKRRKSITTWVFFLDSHAFILPVFGAKLLGSKIVFPLAASIKGSAKAQNNWLNNIMMLFESITFDFADFIILYSRNLISSWDLDQYSSKILIAHEHFLDFKAFTVTTPLSDRPPLIGYIGRLSGEKGVQHFARALPAILSDQKNLRVLIGGNGQLRDSIAASLHEGIAARVDLPGWISHDDLPGYLNQLRLLVLPSYSEGLPNIMLEAMACGTPVLATPVGAVLDVIIDGKTGFIMENNSPECIAENVMRALEHPGLERIAEAGRRFVEENFTFDKAVENWEYILQDIE